MAKAHAPDSNPIEALLSERTQFLNWLARLDAAGEGGSAAVPEGVRTRVKADYEARLEQVVTQLRSHSASIAEQLDALRARKGDLIDRESVAKERMSEAEIRHAVGEFDESKWQEIRNDQTKILSATRDELSRTTAEIDRLTEVQTLVNAPAAPPPPEPEPEPEPMSLPRLVERSMPPIPSISTIASTAPNPAVMADIPPLNLDLGTPSASPITAAEAEAAAASAARRVSRAAPKREEPPQPPARTEWIPNDKAARAPAPKLDELAFLKSVAPEKPGPKRASGGIPRPPEANSPPAPPAAPERPSEAMQGITRADPFASKTQPAIPDTIPAQGSGSRASQAAPKTLKCGECGTLNRPTEWYCERCGAELAAL